MSEQNEETKATEAQPEVESAAAAGSNDLKLNSLFAFKVGMSSVYDEDGKSVPVTVLKYEPWVVSQVKTPEADGYSAIQIACAPKRASRTSNAQRGHLNKAGFEHGARFLKEVRQDLPEGVALGQKVDIASLAKGDKVRMTAKSKGRGFAGTMKRWDFGGGPASHGSGFHRKPGSIGNRTWPGKVLAGKKMAGHFGDETITVKNVTVVDVLAEDGVVLVKGPVPGSKDTLVKLMKV